MRYLLGFILVCFLLLLLSKRACKPQKLENGRAIAEEVEQRTVKRFPEKQILGEAARIGDSLTTLADSLLMVRLAAGLNAGGLAGARQHYPPEKYPEVQELAGRFGSPLTREALPARQSLPPRVAPLSQREILYTRAIKYRESVCGPCHGAGAEKNTLLLQKQFPGFTYRPYKPDQTMGFWRLPIKRKAVLETLTLRGMKKPRPRT